MKIQTTPDLTSTNKVINNRLRCKKFYWKKKALGLCTNCTDPALPDRTQCAHCRDVNKKSQEKRKDKIKAYKRSIRHIENARKKTPEYKARRNFLRRERRRTDPAWGLDDRLRKRIGRAMRDHAKIRKGGRTYELIGCSIPELMAHLEKQFLSGMTWENRNLWHVDHIKPCAAFDLTKLDQQKECFHYSNLRPLWAFDNMSKHDKWEEEKVA